MKAKCYECGIEKEMKSHNVYFSNTVSGLGEVYTYKYDDCRIAQAKKSILGTLSYHNHLVSIRNLEQIFKDISRN